MKKVLSVFMLFVLFQSCSNKNLPLGENHINPLVTLPQGWKLASSYIKKFPLGIQLFLFDSIFNGQKTKAFCLAYDSKISSFEFKPVLANKPKTISAFCKDEPGVTYACINGGFFGANQSFSLVKYNDSILSTNIKVLTRPYNGIKTSYYPTRAAFGIDATGQPSVTWIYNVGNGNDSIYSYPLPNQNELNIAPKSAPSSAFPADGSIWKTVSAIGGSPVLIKDNAIQITDKEELIVIDNASLRARSGIGYLENGIVLLFAVEGDNLPNYAGINLNNFAELIKAFNCAAAINLDGGSSTYMKVNNKQTVKPIHNGAERPVISAVLIKKKING